MAKNPDIEIFIRDDSGFSNALFYKLAGVRSQYCAVGLASNEVLKQRLKRAKSC